MAAPTERVPTDLTGRLEAWAARTPTASALIWGEGAARSALSFRDLADLSARWASVLAAQRIRPGDRVLVLQGLSPQLYLSLLALFRLGAVAVLPDPEALAATVAAAITRVQPKAVIGGRAVLAMRRLGVGVPGLGSIPRALSTDAVLAFGPSLPWRAVAARQAPMARPGPGAPALITLTSGSTGVPKAIVRSHGFLQAQEAAIAAAGYRPEPGAAVLCTLPVFVLANLGAGAASVLPAVRLRHPDGTTARRLLAQARAERVRTLLASPALARALTEAGGEPLPLVRDVFTGGGPVPPDLLDALARLCPVAAIHAAYGSSEAEPIAHLTRAELTASDRAAYGQGQGLPVGRPTPGTRVALLPTVPREPWAGGDPSLADGSAGEVVVAGAHVVRGYLDGVGDELTKIRGADGTVWHRTGDAARRDADGGLFLLGRAAERGPLGTYPFQVEAVARTLFPGRDLACVRLEAGLVLALGGGPPVPRGVPPALSALGVVRIARVPRIPRERRHATKTDAPALRRLLGEPASAAR